MCLEQKPPALGRVMGQQLTAPTLSTQTPNFRAGSKLHGVKNLYALCKHFSAGLLSACQGAEKQTALPSPNRSTTRIMLQRAVVQLLPFPPKAGNIFFSKIPSAPRIIIDIKKSLFHFTCCIAQNAKTQEKKVSLYISCISYLFAWVL